MRTDVPADALLESWGKFKADGLDLAAISAHQAEAVRIFDRAGWR